MRPNFCYMGRVRFLRCHLRRGANHYPKEHSALSAPRHTTPAAAGREPAGFDFKHAATVLTDVAARAGAAIMRRYREPGAVSLKDDRSPVTRADQDSEAIVLEALAALAPDIRVVSEESYAGGTTPLPDRFFLVDPLDGTKEFIQKRSDFTINIALIEHGRPSFGLVYAPARARMALTIAPGMAIETDLAPDSVGADLGRLSQRPLRARTPRAGGLTALVSHSHLDPDTETFLTKLEIAERWGIGSSLKFIAIAKGEADVYPRFAPTMEWDTAAGQAVLEAAGGSVVDAHGLPLRYGKADRDLRNPSFIAWGARQD